MEINGIVKEVISQFAFPGTIKECIPYGSGHINDTFCLTFLTEKGEKRYILQRMNKNILRGR